MTEGLPFFPLLRPCIGIRKLPAVVLSYEGQIETSPSLACGALRGLSRTRNTAAPSRIRQSIAYVSGGPNFRWRARPERDKTASERVYPIAR